MPSGRRGAAVRLVLDTNVVVSALTQPAGERDAR